MFKALLIKHPCFLIDIGKLRYNLIFVVFARIFFGRKCISYSKISTIRIEPTTWVNYPNIMNYPWVNYPNKIRAHRGKNFFTLTWDNTLIGPTQAVVSAELYDIQSTIERFSVKATMHKSAKKKRNEIFKFPSPKYFWTFKIFGEIKIKKKGCKLVGHHF